MRPLSAMQYIFDDGTPPGYFETHSLENTRWRSTSAVRRELDEEAVGWTVRQFQKDFKNQLENRHLQEPPTPVTGCYQIKNIPIKILQQPWQKIPCVFILREDEPA